MAIEYRYEMAGVIDEAHGVKKGSNKFHAPAFCVSPSAATASEGTSCPGSRLGRAREWGVGLFLKNNPMQSRIHGKKIPLASKCRFFPTQVFSDTGVRRFDLCRYDDTITRSRA